MNRYESVLAFVQANHDRLRGPWRGYGHGWVDGHSTAATWFVGFLESTGEVVAVQTTATIGAVQELGVIPSRDPRECDQLLVGWRDVAPPMLDWVRERLLLHQRHPEFYRQPPREDADAADLRASFERAIADWDDE